MKVYKDYRRDYGQMPLYAKDSAFAVSGEQLKKCLRNRNPFKSDSPNWDHVASASGYLVSQLKDGTWWVRNFRVGAPLFAPDYWFRIPDAAGKRLLKIKEFVETL